MKLRRLELKDAKYMYEWMQDERVTENMKTNFRNLTLDDCVEFIKKSWMDQLNIHLAVTDDNDEYMGTVSLKNINNKFSCAEFAITIRYCAMGKGIASFGMKEIIKIALSEINMKYVYWYVDKDNIRARRFYNKMGYLELNEVQKHQLKDLLYVSDNYKWYLVKKVEGAVDNGI